MPYSDDELQALYGGLGDSTLGFSQPAVASQPDPTPQSVPYKLGKQIANIIPQGLNVLSGDINRVAGYIDPNAVTPQYQASIANPVPAFNVGPSNGFKDWALNDAAPQLAAMVLPYEGVLRGAAALGGVAKLAELPMLARAGAEAIAQGGTNFLSGDNFGDSSQQGAMGVASGILQQTVPRLARLPLLAAVSAAGTDGNLLGSIVNTGFNMIPGFHGDIPKVTSPTIVDRGFQDIADVIAPQTAPWVPSPEDFNQQTPAHVQYTPDELNSDISQQAIPSSSPASANQAMGLTSDASLYDRGTPYGDAFANIQPPQLEDANSKYNLVDAPELAGVEQKPEVPIIEAPSVPLETSISKFQISDLAKAISQNRRAGTQLELVDGSKETLNPLGGIDSNGIQTNNGFVAESIVSRVLNPEGQIVWQKAPKPTESFNADDQRLLDQLNSKPVESFSSVETPASPVTETEPIQVMNPQGELVAPQPTQVGPHIISTVLDEGDGQYLSGDKWNSPHAKGEGNITKPHLELGNIVEPGVVNSAFLVKDEKGVIRVTKDRSEAARIAESAGQRKPETVGQPLQSEDLQEPFNQETQAAQILQKEKVQDHQILHGVVEQQLRDNLSNAADPISKRIAGRKLAEHLKANNPAELEKLQAKAADLVKESEGDPKLATEGKDSIARWQVRYKNQGGQISPELAIVLATGGIAGLVAYQQSKGDIGYTLAATLVGAGLGFAGVKAIKNLRLNVGPEVKPKNVKIPDATLKEKFSKLKKATLETPGGMAVAGRGGILANTIRLAEGLSGLGDSPIFRDNELTSGGLVANLIHKINTSLESVKFLAPSEGFMDAASRFYRGQLADPVAIKKLLDQGGLGEADFVKLSKADKKAYPEKWMTLEDPDSTNIHGKLWKDMSAEEKAQHPDIQPTQVYHVTNDTKAKLKQLQSDTLARYATTDADKEFMKFPQTAYDVRDTMMQLLHNALPEGGQRNKLMGTTGQYAARSFDAILDPKWYPSEVNIQKQMDMIGEHLEGRFLQKYGYDDPGTGRIRIQNNGKDYYIDPKAKDEWDNLHTPESLHGLVAQQIKEIKQRAALVGSGMYKKGDLSIAGNIFEGRKDLESSTLTLLGEQKNLFQLVSNTTSKLAPATRAAVSISKLVEEIEPRTGLPFGYKDPVEYNKAINSVKEQLRVVTDPREKQALTTKLEELSSYTSISNQNPRLGMFEGAYLGRMAKDQLIGIEHPFGFLDNEIGQGLARFNQLVKDTHLVLNPVTQVRNLWQIPMFLAMGRATTSFDHMQTMWKMLWHNDFSSSVGQRVVANGVLEGNPVTNEFKRSLQDLVSGKVDQDIFTTAAKKGWNLANKLYAFPDNFVRGVVYLAAEERAAKAAKVSVDDANESVMAQARKFMTERTIDYGAAPQAIKVLRNVPFVSMYLTYSHQILKIAKNMAADALKGDFHAGATLGAFASVPFVLQSMAENALSPKDREDWQRGQRMVQDYSRPRFKMPLSRNKDGSFNYMDITPMSHFNDFQMMGRSIARGDWKSVMAVNPLIGLDNTPLLSLMSDQMVGKDSHTGKPFREGTQGIADRGLAVAKELTPPWVPGLGYEYQKDAPESLGGSLGVTNLRNGRTNTIAGALSRNLTGIDLTQVNPDIATRNFVAEAKGHIADEQQYLRDALQSTVNDDAKKRAIAKFTEAVQHITGDMQAKIQSRPN